MVLGRYTELDQVLTCKTYQKRPSYPPDTIVLAPERFIYETHGTKQKYMASVSPVRESMLYVVNLYLRSHILKRHSCCQVNWTLCQNEVSGWQMFCLRWLRLRHHIFKTHFWSRKHKTLQSRRDWRVLNLQSQVKSLKTLQSQVRSVRHQICELMETLQSQLKQHIWPETKEFSTIWPGKMWCLS